MRILVSLALCFAFGSVSVPAQEAKAEPKKWSGPPCAATPAQKPRALAPGF